MNVLFDARFITPRRSGVGRVTEMLLKTLLGSGRDLTIHVMYKPPLDKMLLGDHPVLVRTPFDSHPWGDIHRNTFIRDLIRKRNIDLYFSPAFYCLQMAQRIPQVVLIHDLAVFDEPKTMPVMFGLYLRAMIRSSVRNARRITVPSEFIRKQLSDRFPSAQEKIRVAHWGVTPVFRGYNDTLAESVRNHYCLPPRFLLSVVTVEPRKNLLPLLDAFAIYSNRSSDPLPLVIAGADGFKAYQVHARAERADLSTRVRFLGYVPDHELALLYGLAQCMIFPSLYEGFGLPVIEAMAAGCPVITSRTSAMPEAAGEAALLIDPTDINDMERAMRVLTEDATIRQQMSRAGRIRVESMNWDDTAEAYRRIFYEAAG